MKFCFKLVFIFCLHLLFLCVFYNINRHVCCCCMLILLFWFLFFFSCFCFYFSFVLLLVFLLFYGFCLFLLLVGFCWFCKSQEFIHFWVWLLLLLLQLELTTMAALTYVVGVVWFENHTHQSSISHIFFSFGCKHMCKQNFNKTNSYFLLLFYFYFFLKCTNCFIDTSSIISGVFLDFYVLFFF